MDAVGRQSLGFRVDKYDNGASVLNTGTTVEASAGGRVQVDGEVYALTEFHFHTPSEHHIGTEVFAMEAPFVFAEEGKHQLCPNRHNAMERDRVPD